MLIGAGFITLGVRILRDSTLLYGGLLRTLERFGPPFPFYLDRVIYPYMEFHQEGFAIVAAIGAILVGVQLLAGFLVSLGALGACLLVLNFALATAYGDVAALATYTGLVAALILMGCTGAGLTWGLDAWLAARLNPAIVLFPLRRRLPD